MRRTPLEAGRWAGRGEARCIVRANVDGKLLAKDGRHFGGRRGEV
jgi:hypothetical protein